MSDEAPEQIATEPPPEPPTPVVKPKRKLGFRHKKALIAVIAKKELSHAVGYKDLAPQFGMTEGALRRLYCEWNKGGIDLEAPQTADEKRIDARVQHEAHLALLRRVREVAMHGLQGLLAIAEDKMSKGDLLALENVGVTKAIGSLAKVNREIESAEKGYMAVLEEIRSGVREEKKINDSAIPVDTRTQIINVNDEQKALAALG